MIEFLATNELRVQPPEKPLARRAMRKAFYFTSQGAPIFAWLHQRENTAHDHGVLLCPPIGHEQVHSHRSLRHLAENLADAGYRVLRFDYHGTGDSATLNEGADGHSTWLANIRDLIACLREQYSCRHISLMGLRIGASLAYQIATEQDVDNLVLWEPVVRGRTHVRELKAVSSMASCNAPQADGVEAAGFLYGKKLCDALGRIDLLQGRPRCRRALILTRDDIPSHGGLLQHLTALGIDSEERALPGYADMLADPHFTKVPAQAIAGTVNWLNAGGSPAVGNRERPQGPVQQQTALVANPIRERIVQISGQPDLFGILSESAQCQQLPLIVLANSGAAHRVGPGDLYVKLSRHLAGLGFRCLRLDLSGLGDSVTTDPASENDSYPSTGFRDIDLTLKFAQKELAADRIVLMGLCSGAYFAFQSAVQNPDPALVESVLINPLTFFWQDGMTLEACPAEQISKGLYYFKAALKPEKWLKLLSGRTKVGVLGGLKILGQRLGLLSLPNPQSVDKKDRLGHPASDDLRGDLDRAAAAGRRLAFFFSRSDPGYGILQFSARRKVKQLCAARTMTIRFVEEADHTFSRHAARQELIQRIGDYLCRRYLSV